MHLRAAVAAVAVVDTVVGSAAVTWALASVAGAALRARTLPECTAVSGTTDVLVPRVLGLAWAHTMTTGAAIATTIPTAAICPRTDPSIPVTMCVDVDGGNVSYSLG